MQRALAEVQAEQGVAGGGPESISPLKGRWRASRAIAAEHDEPSHENAIPPEAPQHARLSHDESRRTFSPSTWAGTVQLRLGSTQAKERERERERAAVHFAAVLRYARVIPRNEAVARRRGRGIKREHGFHSAAFARRDTTASDLSSMIKHKSPSTSRAEY
jgi:hypothetical protein